MRRFTWMVGCVVAISLGSAFAGDTGASDLERLRSLEGEWVRLDEDGNPGTEVVSQWRVTSNGSAVIETLYPGSPDHEMVTVYHEDLGGLMLTHYCAIGNQPRMRQVQRAEPNVLEFTCAGGTNLESEDDTHMHHAKIEWVDRDHIRAWWTAHENGDVHHVAEFDLVRKR